MTNKKVDFTKFDLEHYVGKFAQIDTKRSRAGDAWFKCCFHEEKTASLHVSDKQVYHCHGCGKSGGILSFVKEVNNITTEEALKIIADESGQETVVVERDIVPIEFYAPKEYEAVYSYNDGFVLKYRLKNKSFLWANFENEQWWSGTGNYDVKLYAPKGISGTVVIAEGEKDADTLCYMGFNGVSSPNGTYKWKDSYTEQLKQADSVVILNDNDYLGIAGAQLCQKYLKDAGIMTKRVSPLEINDNDIDRYDITDAVNEVGVEEAQIRLQAIINDERGWNALWNDEPVTQKPEIIEAEVVFKSGMGDDYDNLILKAVQETLQDGDVSELTTVELNKYAKENHIGIRRIQKRIKEQVDIERNRLEVDTVKSEIINVKDFNMSIDIAGSGYTIVGDAGAIYDSNGNEILGHFLAFAGVVLDAEVGQDTNVKVALVYNTPQNLQKMHLLVVPKKSLVASLDMIKLLSAYNINVTQINGMQVVQYLQDLQNFFSEKTVVLKSLSRFGWYKNNLMPYEQKESEIVFDSTVAQPTADKLLQTKGSREKSLQLIREIAQYSEASATILGAAVGSLVLSYVNKGGNQSFALNIWNETSTGKSVTCQGVASLFGYPFKDSGWWADGNATMNKDIYHNSLLGNLPAFIDDPARLRGYKSDQKRDYVFSVTSGQGRGRMQRSGEIPKDVKDWCNIMIMTNETPFIDESIEDGGARARCLEVCFDRPLERDVVTHWIDLMTDNYGHFALDIANKIREMGRIKIDKTIREHIRWFDTRGVDGKRAINASMIVMGLQIADMALDLDALEIHEWLAKQIRGSGALSDGERAYEKLMRRVEVSQEIYRNVYDRNGTIIGIFGYALNGAKVLNLPLATLGKYGKEDGFDTGNLINWCHQNGKMVTSYDENGQPSPQMISNNASVVRVMQLYYNWQGKPMIGEANEGFTFETIPTEKEGYE